MAKGYWIAHVTITNPERYKDYVAANAIAFKKYNARFIVRGGECETYGAALSPTQRHVVIEFETYAIAKACKVSPEYKAAEKIRDEASIANIVVIEGWAG